MFTRPCSAQGSTCRTLSSNWGTLRDSLRVWRPVKTRRPSPPSYQLINKSLIGSRLEQENYLSSKTIWNFLTLRASKISRASWTTASPAWTMVWRRWRQSPDRDLPPPPRQQTLPSQRMTRIRVLLATATVRKNINTTCRKLMKMKKWRKWKKCLKLS